MNGIRGFHNLHDLCVPKILIKLRLEIEVEPQLLGLFSNNFSKYFETFSNFVIQFHMLICLFEI